MVSATEVLLLTVVINGALIAAASPSSTASEPQTSGGSTDAVDVEPFMVMRLTHEAIRVMLADTTRALGDAEDASGSSVADATAAAAQLRRAWRDFGVVLRMHMQQEELGLFPLLDAQFDGAVTRAGLVGEHKDDVQHRKAIDVLLGDLGTAIREESLPQLREALAQYTQDHEAHLAHEEEVMAPLVPRVAPTAVERGAAVRKILRGASGKWVKQALPIIVSRLAAGRPPAMLEKFVLALQLSLSDAEYSRAWSAVADAVSPEQRARLASAGAEGPGRQLSDAAKHKQFSAGTLDREIAGRGKKLFKGLSPDKAVYVASPLPLRARDSTLHRHSPPLRRRNKVKQFGDRVGIVDDNSGTDL